MSMHESLHPGPRHYGTMQTPAPYWKRAHRSWIFWAGVVLMFAAIMVYVLSFDLAWRPRGGAAQPAPSSAAGK